MSTSDDAIAYIKDKQKELIATYASVDNFPSVEKPWAMFMAGSPGAGKTEISESLILLNREIDPSAKIVRIDADEIRNFLVPFYKGTNSDEVQGAASLGVQKIFDSVLKHHQSFILDGTFAHFKVSRQNVERCVSRGMKVGVFFVYQDPVVAWKFTKIREKREGRTIPKNAFIDAYFSAKDNVNKVKSEFGNTVTVDLVIKNYENRVEKVHFNVDKIDSFIKNEYNPESLEKGLI